MKGFAFVPQADAVVLVLLFLLWSNQLRRSSCAAAVRRAASVRVEPNHVTRGWAVCNRAVCASPSGTHRSPSIWRACAAARCRWW